MSTGTANVPFSSNLSELLTDVLVNGASLFVANTALLLHSLTFYCGLKIRLL